MVATAYAPYISLKSPRCMRPVCSNIVGPYFAMPTTVFSCSSSSITTSTLLHANIETHRKTRHRKPFLLSWCPYRFAAPTLFCAVVCRDAELTMSGPVTITGNEARYSGGAIWTHGKVTLPATADISGNTATFVSLACGCCCGCCCSGSRTRGASLSATTLKVAGLFTVTGRLGNEKSSRSGCGHAAET